MQKHTPTATGGNGLRTFSFHGKHTIRTTVGQDGIPRWVARDVAEALGYPKSSLTNMKRLVSHVPEEWKGRNPIPTTSGMQALVTLSEPGLFFFLNRSDKASALPFQKWVAGEVLPVLRRTGVYSIQDPALDRRPRLSGALLGKMKDHLGHTGTTEAMIRIWPEWFADLPGERPKGPQQVVTPTLGLTEPLRLELRQVEV